MATKLEYAWAAGFFDGEGSVSIRLLRYGPERRAHYGLYLRVAQVERGPLDKFRAIFQTGSVRLSRAYDENRAPYHDWCCAGSSADRLLRSMLPYFTVKRERAMLGIEFYQYSRKTGKRLTPEQLELRRAYFDRMRHLNLRQIPRTAAETKSRDAQAAMLARSDSPVCIDDKDAEDGGNSRPRLVRVS